MDVGVHDESCLIYLQVLKRCAREAADIGKEEASNSSAIMLLTQVT